MLIGEVSFIVLCKNNTHYIIYIYCVNDKYKIIIIIKYYSIGNVLFSVFTVQRIFINFYILSIPSHFGIFLMLVISFQNTNFEKVTLVLT